MPAQGLQGGFHVDTTHTQKKTLVWTLHCCIDPDGRNVSTVSEVCVLHWPPGNSAPFVRHVCVLLNARCQGAGRSRHRVCSLLPSAALLRVPPQCATHLNVSNIRCAFSKSLQSPLLALLSFGIWFWLWGSRTPPALFPFQEHPAEGNSSWLLAFCKRGEQIFLNIRKNIN